MTLSCLVRVHFIRQGFGSRWRLSTFKFSGKGYKQPLINYVNAKTDLNIVNYSILTGSGQSKLCTQKHGGINLAIELMLPTSSSDFL